MLEYTGSFKTSEVDMADLSEADRARFELVQQKDMRLQMRDMQEAMRSLAEEEQRLKSDVHGMEDMMKKVRQSEQGLPLRGNLDARDEEFLWSNCTAKDRSHFKGRLDEHKIKLAAQTSTDLVMAEQGAGPSQLHGSDLPELGRPQVPAPFSRASVLSETEILLSGSRDEDIELARRLGDL
ncbi:hypothetical protein R1sor_004456 [Riccia sorocarpa]|uniref:Uncharacterized protein n=1 Tax=Riccia sorocarpa TaxID=122646 RepID=A0ABD3HKI7_9MARC